MQFLVAVILVLRCVDAVSTTGYVAFVTALSDPNVSEITINDELLRLPDRGGPYSISRNLTISGARADNILDTSGSVGLLLLTPNNTITFRHLTIVYRTSFVTDLRANFLFLQNNTVLHFTNSTQRSLVCLPRTDNFTIPRSSRVPGVNSFIVDPYYCDNAGCWKDTVIGYDLARDVTNNGVTVLILSTNAIGTCQYFADAECLRVADPQTCLLQRLANVLADDSSSSSLPPSTLPIWAIILIVIGGVVIITSIGASVWWFRSRKPRDASVAPASLPPSLMMPSNDLPRPSHDSTFTDSSTFLPSGVQIGLLLGAGMFGRVYKGYYHGKSVAIKLLERAGNVEMHVSKTLQHPNIVRIYETFPGTADMTGVIIMEYCDGGALSRRLGQLPMDVMIPLLLDVAQGMRYLQWQHVVHGDLKSENILLISDNTNECGFTAKVSDFGLSRLIPVEESSYRTLSVGTVSHLDAQVIKTGRVTHSSDVYAFGIVMLELTRGERIWGAMHPLQIMERVVKGERPTFSPGIMPEYVALAQRCWDADPNERPSFKDITSELQEMYSSMSRPHFL